MNIYRESEIPSHLKQHFEPVGIGLEATPDEFVATMVDVFREVWRILRDDGTLWLNLGDSYAQSGMGGNPAESRHRKQATNTGSLIPGRQAPPGLKPKDLCGIPWRVALALQADGWTLRSDIIWAKPNPMPESVTDRPTKSHEYLFLLTKRPRYFYDAEAAREAGPTYTRKAGGYTQHHKQGASRFGGKGGFSDSDVTTVGRNLRTVWTIPTESFKEAHFATFPRKLVVPCVKAGTSDRGCCPECGAPWVRIVERDRKATRPGDSSKIRIPKGWAQAGKHNASEWMRDRKEIGNRDLYRHVTEVRTTGWKPGCECICSWMGQDGTRRFTEPGGYGRLVPCTVLDPFAGSGTVGVVAKQLGRSFIGIELNPEYCEMARKRIANPEPAPEVPEVAGQMTLEGLG